MRGLDFLVIGAQKAGTTTLWQLLRDHPQLAFPADKESPYFTDDATFARGLESYTSTSFGDADPAALWGTVTPQYMTGVTGPGVRGRPIEEVVDRIRQVLPDVKLIALLRDPVERAISHHRMSVRRGLEQRPLREALSQQLATAALVAARARPSETNGYLTWGEYGRILAAYLASFTREQMMVVLTEELEADPGELVGRLAAFLGVDDSWRPEQLEQRHMVGGDELRVPNEAAQALARTLAAQLPSELRGVVELTIEEWNTIGGDSREPVPEPTLSALRSHFARDGARIQRLSGVTVPWAAPPPTVPAVPSVSQPEVSIVILAHDSPSELEALLASIVTNTHDSYEIVVVDNGSSPAGREAHAAQAATHGARLIGLSENLTFSVANNIGVGESRGEEIVLVNSDVVVTAGWLRNMRAALHSATDVGAVGPRSNFAPGPQGGVWLDDSSPAGIQEYGRHFNTSDPGRWFDIEWLAGFAILVRRPAFEAAGGFDETLRWFAGEDIALSQALHSNGWRTLCAGDTFLYHAGHHTFYATGANRSATRFGRPTTDPPKAAGAGGRLLVDEQGTVFEVHDGVACHLETWHAALLIRAGRPLEETTRAELDELPLGPPISLCRARGTNDVFVLHNGQRRRVRGNYERLRRLPALAMISQAQLIQIPEGEPVDVQDALGPVPEIRKWLPSNPAAIVPERLASVQQVASEIGEALQSGQGYALIRLELDEVLVLNHGMWPAPPLDRARAGVRGGPWAGAAALRRAVLTADAVGVIEDRSNPYAAPLLEELLFHYDLYPRLRCSASMGLRLRGLDPDTGAPSGPSPLAPLLRGRRVAMVCPKAVTDVSSERQEAYQRSRGFDIRSKLGLDDLHDLDAVFGELAADRGSFDVVLTVGGVPTKSLCARLARELGVVALDMGWGGLGDIAHPRLDGGRNPLVRLRGEVETYLERAATPPPPAAHELEGQLVHAGGGPIFYIERGLAREVTHESLLALFDHEPVEVTRAALVTTPLGTPLCAVHEPLTQPYALLDGKKVPLDIGVPAVTVHDMALEPIPTDERQVTI